jgi:hypothetical protein
LALLVRYRNTRIPITRTWQHANRSPLFDVDPHTLDRRTDQTRVGILAIALPADRDVIPMIDLDVLVILRRLRLEQVTDGSCRRVLPNAVFHHHTNPDGLIVLG